MGRLAERGNLFVPARHADRIHGVFLIGLGPHSIGFLRLHGFAAGDEQQGAEGKVHGWTI